MRVKAFHSPRFGPDVAQKYATLAEFWPFYLHEHSKPLTRGLHIAGTLGSLTLAIVLVVFWSWWGLLVGLGSGYAVAWFAHFVVQRNRPATFTYPIKSFLSDWKLVGYFLTGRLGAQLEKHGLR